MTLCLGWPYGADPQNAVVLTYVAMFVGGFLIGSGTLSYVAALFVGAVVGFCLGVLY